jgi:hypothetical protein
MLLQKSSYNAGDVVSFKLVNGDEIVAEIVEQTDSGFVLRRPQTVMPSQKGIGLIQSLFTSEQEKVTVQQQHIMMHGETIKEMKSHYLQTTTGISLAV